AFIRHLRPALAAAMLTAGPTLTIAEGEPEPSEYPSKTSVEALIQKAHRNNPELKAAHARWVAATERIPQARALPDPMLEYGYFVERMDTRQTFRIAQPFPAFGIRRSRGNSPKKTHGSLRTPWRSLPPTSVWIFRKQRRN